MGMLDVSEFWMLGLRDQPVRESIVAAWEFMVEGRGCKFRFRLRI